MLIEARFENHRSIREELVLTMEASTSATSKDPRPRAVEGSQKSLLPAVALYGANASGKSNVLSALRFMCKAVRDSARHWDPEGGVSRSPFAWGPSSDQASLYEVTYLVDGTRFCYGFTVDDERVQEEWLEAWPNKRRQLWFSRDGDTYKFGDHLAGQRDAIKETTRPNALFLSNAVQFRHEQLHPVHRWFLGVGFQHAPSLFEPRGEDRGIRTLQKVLNYQGSPDKFPMVRTDPEQLAQWLEGLKGLLREADLGITDLALSEDGEPARPSRRGSENSGIRIQHQHESHQAWLPLEQESEGTLAVIRHGPQILSALRNGRLYVADELESSLHPLLVRSIVERFNNPNSNPHGAQLIFSTHDSSLLGTALGEPPLRRDQIWLTEKDKEGASTLTPLTDFKPRKGENLERGLLQGRYGAVPYLSPILPEAPDKKA